MAFLKSKSAIRKIDWGVTYLWDVRFVDAPAPFDEWFPALDVEIQKYSLDTHELAAYMSTYSLPKSTTAFDMKITYADDIDRTILDWISDWINKEILNDGQLVTPIGDCVKLVQAVKLNRQKQVIGKPMNYWVHPKGAGYFNGDSGSNLPSNTIEFVIAGTI